MSVSASSIPKRASAQLYLSSARRQTLRVHSQLCNSCVSAHTNRQPKDDLDIARSKFKVFDKDSSGIAQHACAGHESHAVFSSLVPICIGLRRRVLLSFIDGVERGH